MPPPSVLVWNLKFICNHCKSVTLIVELPFADYRADVKMPLYEKPFDCLVCHENHFLVFLAPTLRPDNFTSVQIKQFIEENKK